MNNKKAYERKLNNFKDYEIGKLKEITAQQQKAMFKLTDFMKKQDQVLTTMAGILAEQDQQLHGMTETVKAQEHVVKRFLAEYDKLHLENATERKLIEAVIEMRENLKKECFWLEKQGEEYSKGYESLKNYKEDCTEILEEIGSVEITEGTEEIGQDYNPELHEVIETIPFSGEEGIYNTKRICRVYSDGYCWKNEKRRIKVGVGVCQ